MILRSCVKSGTREAEFAGGGEASDTGSSTNFGPASSFSSSGEVSMSTEKDVVDEYGDDDACDAVTELDSREIVGGSVSNVVSDSSETSGTEVARFTALPHKIFSSDKSESHSGHLKLERSKTEPPTHNSQFAQEAANISDDSDSEQQKLKLLKRIATVRDNGTVEFEIPGDEESKVLGVESQSVCNEVEDEPLDELELHYIPPIQIVMLIVGTRGDVQPFIAIGKRLQLIKYGLVYASLLTELLLQEYGHRVRLATHANFKEFVLSAGLEFYPLGGDPKVLAGYMVKNKGFLPSAPSEIPVQRNQLKDIISSLLPACEEPDMDTGVPFKPDAIIANPPAYGHTHVAEALKIPIHIFFTMPWTPTSEFPHPLSRIKQPAGYRLSYQIVDSLIWLGIRDMINDTRKRKLKLRPVTYLSSSQVSVLDIPHGYIWSPHLVSKPKDWGPKVDVVGFCFLDLASGYEPPESLVNWLKDGQKPIYIGFGSLPVQEPEKMTQIIVEALERTGQRGIINKGWGGLGNLAEPKDFVYLLDNCPHDWLFLQCSAVVSLLQLLLVFLYLLAIRLAIGEDRINRTGFTKTGTGTGPRYRIYLPEITKGSARSLSYRIGTGLDRTGTGSYRIIVYRQELDRNWFLPNRINRIKTGSVSVLVPVHHGGAGTTAAGLKAACPTTIVPFFGDQPFWGERVHARGVGPPPIPIDEFSLPKLVEAIEFMLDPKVKERAVELAKAMENEDGVTGAVKAFFKHLPRNNEPDLDETPARRSLFSLRRCLGFC
ncbi:hypothetical protein H5410_047293 [Solanum commersonii]|uniref:Glycosyltransferase family 28 N-terminal domain-containing protein n=1 Tax=Solanum commersonii TaxID=4109 RepID=A0A9J5XEQ4_SOLCO|nr:hypothetical protein H5410_047293 [Solanum commersonii]